MKMTPKELVSLFTKHGLISDDAAEIDEALELVDEDEEAEINALELLSEYADERQIWFSLGDCVEEEIVEEFKSNFENLLEISEGKISIKGLSSTPEAGTKISENQQIKISFVWNNKDYEFSFSKVEPDSFVNGFSKWAFEALNGDFLLINDDHPFGYHIPKELINELESIGLKNYVS
jgi:hypothetical protein